MTSQPDSKTIAIHKMTNISRCKTIRQLKIGQLIEYNMKHFF